MENPGTARVQTVYRRDFEYLEKSFSSRKSIDTAISEIQLQFNHGGYRTLYQGDSIPQKETQETSDAEHPVDPAEPPVDHIEPPDTPVESPVDPGATLFDTYLAVKRSLADKLKSVLKIMATCDTLDVNPECNSNIVKSQISAVANHQWTYNEGHETIFCRHMTFEHRHQGTQTIVKVPVRYLGMSGEEIFLENRDIAIEALEQQKAELAKKIKKVSKPIQNQIDDIEDKISMLKDCSGKEPCQKNR